MADRAAGVIRSTEPARPTEIVAEVAPPARDRIDRALDAAAAARDGWSRDALTRSAALHAWAQAVEGEADALATLVAREVGKPIGEAQAEVVRAVALIRFYAQVALDPVGEVLPGPAATIQVQVRRRPLGTILAICPWNFPLAIPAWKIAPALAYGNAVLFKPSSEAIGVGQRLVELAHRSIPQAMLSFLPIPGAETRRLLTDHRVDGLTFTGSSEVGQSLIAEAASRSVPVQAEMGGQNASIVLDDARLDDAVATIVGAAMGYAGQKCTATRRILVSRSVASDFVPMLVDAVERLQVGDPLDPATRVGPVISEQARDHVASSVREACARGGRLLVGAGVPDGQGWFIAPAVIDVGDPADAFVREETFGPAVAVLTVDSDAEAIAIANSTRFGLAGAVFGSDVHRATSVAEQLNVGMIRVNGPTTGADYWAPFGGHGASGFGPREQGREVASFMTSSRTISIPTT